MDLGLIPPDDAGAGEASSAKTARAAAVTALPIVIEDDDPVYVSARELLADGYGGVVLRGPPGTSKTWYAAQIAAKLAGGDPTRTRTVQFHPSYQYEDFVEGFVPTRDGLFRLRPKHLLQICRAAEDSGGVHVLVVDEVSRVDPARVFGEALTYIEKTKRGVEFRLASGRPFSIPENLVVLGTMNVFDRGVDQVDVALERRLGFIALDPDPDLLKVILGKNSVDEALQAEIVNFFRHVYRHPNPYCRIGHAYFNTVRDLESLRRLWRHQLKFVFERAFPAGDDEGFAQIQRWWDRMIQNVSPGNERVAQVDADGVATDPVDQSNAPASQ